MEDSMKLTLLETELKGVELNERCRACLNNRGEKMSVFQRRETDETQTTKINEMLMSFALIEVMENDGLPSLICSECLRNTHIAFNFKKQCENSDAELRSLLRLSQSNSNTTKVKIEKSCQDTANVEEETQLPHLREPKLEIEYRLPDTSDCQIYEKRPRNKRTKKKKSKHSHGLKIENNDVDCGGYVDDETSQPLFPCSECIQCFTKQRDLKRHIKNNHGKSNLDAAYCDICNQAFSQAQTLARHMKIHQENQKNKLCTFCGKGFLRSDDLKRHTRIHTGERPYSCDQCPKAYKQSSELKEHIKSHSTAKDYMCTECGKSLATRNGLYVHMKVHRGEKNHECKYCGNRYVTSGELTSHVNHIHSQEKPFTCTYEGCPRAFVTRLSLKIHQHTHTGEKPFQCVTCNKSLSTASSLVEHKRIHTGEKPKICTVCGKRMGNSQALKKHLRIHTGERPYQCKICLEKFICGSTLNTHLKTKHFEKQHECDICHKMFALPTKLRQHMRLHTENKSYICRICGLCFNQNIKLYQHRKTHEVVKTFQHSSLELHPEQIELLPLTAQLVMQPSITQC